MTLPWWNPFAAERLVLRTSLSPTGCRERLRTLQVDYTTAARSYAGPVYGYVGSKRFWLVRNSNWRPGIGPTRRSPFTFAARGRIESAPAGTKITLTVSLNPTIMIMLSLSLVVGIGLSLFLLFAQATQAHSLDTILALDGAFLAIYIGIYLLGRWLMPNDSEYLQSFLRKLLAAQEDD